MKIGIVGAGALGCVFGANLTLGGHEVVVVDVAAPVVDHLERHGLLLAKADGEVHVPLRATTDPASVGACDVVFVLVKTFHTESAMTTARPLVGADSVVVTVQNGLGSDEILARAFEPRQVVCGVTFSGGTVLGPGHVRQQSDAATYVGPFAGDDLAGAQRVVDALVQADCEAAVVHPIAPEVWKKLIVNCMGNAIAALTGLTAGAMVADEAIVALQRGVAGEAVAVAHAAGHTSLDLEETVEAGIGIMRRSGAGKPSMLQDVEAGRRTEIDHLNGAIVRQAALHGVEVPLNAALVALVKGWETAHA